MSVRSERDVARRARDVAIRIPRRTATVLTILLVAIAVLVVIFGLAAIAAANAPRSLAGSAEMRIQQTAAEKDIERAYEQAADQVAKVRALNLAITTPQADQIANKAQSELKTLRHNAFVALGQAQGLAAADAEQHAVAAEGRFGTALPKEPAPSPVLLAPRYYAIVSRMSELATQLADQATTQLTAPASQPPQPSPSPSGSPRPSPSPSPTR